MEHTKSHKTARPLSTFHGGLKLAENKYLSNGSPISALAQSSEYIIPLQQHIGAISEPMVKPGERVLKGQMLAKPGNLVSAAIHSPVSGLKALLLIIMKSL